jgi:hypothetical protein
MVAESIVFCGQIRDVIRAMSYCEVEAQGSSATGVLRSDVRGRHFTATL